MPLYAATSSGNLYTINRTTAAGTLIGSTGEDILALGIDPTTGDLYGATSLSSPNPNALLSVNKITGATSVIGTFAGGAEAYDLAFNAAGDLYAIMRLAGDQTLVLIDPTDASYVTVGLLGGASFGYSGLIKFDGLGNPYIILSSFGESSTWTIDAGTGAMGAIAVTGRILFANGDDLDAPIGSALDDNGDWFNAALIVFATGETHLSKVSNAGVATLIGTLPQYTQGLAWDGTVGTWFDPTDLTDLYCAMGGNTASSLYRLATENYYPTEIGPTGLALTGLAFDPTDGTLFAVTSNNSPSSTGRKLYTIDPTTGTATLKGSLGVSSGQPITDISFKADGTLYGFQGGGGARAIYTINKTTGAATLVGASGLTSSFGGAFEIDSADYSIASHDSEAGLILHFDLATGAAEPVSVFTGAPDDNPVNAATIDVDGLAWAWGNTFSDTTELFTFGLDGAVTTIGSIGNLDATAWDALAWSTAKGALEIPLPCPNDAFEDALVVPADTDTCCTNWAATNTAEEAAWGTSSPFDDAPITWLTFTPSASIEMLFASPNLATMYVFEDAPGASLATVAANNNLVVTVTGTYVPFTVDVTKQYYIAINGYGEYAMAVYTGSLYPQYKHDSYGSVGSQVALAPATNHSFFHGISNLVADPGTSGDALLAVFDQNTSTNDATLDLYRFDGSAWTFDQTIASYPFSVFSGTGKYLATNRRNSVAMATDGTDVWVAACIEDYIAGVATSPALLIYKVGTGLIHTELGTAGAIAGGGAATRTRLSGTGAAIGEIRGVADNGVAWFGMAEWWQPSTWSGRILLVSSGGTTHVPWSTSGVSTAAEASRPDFDVGINDAGSPVTIMADTPGGSAWDHTNVLSWDMHLLAANGTVLATLAADGPGAGATDKKCYPRISRLPDSNGYFYIAYDSTQGYYSVGAPSIGANATGGFASLTRVQQDGSGTWAAISTAGNNAQLGAHGQVEVDESGDSLQVWVMQSSNYFLNNGTSQWVMGGLPWGMDIWADMAYLCPTANGAWVRTNDDFSTGRLSGTVGRTGHNGDVFDNALLLQSGVNIGDTQFAAGLVINNTQALNIYGMSIAINRQNVNCPRIVPTPACAFVITPGPGIYLNPRLIG